jgi:hypothetical protein
MRLNARLGDWMAFSIEVVGNPHWLVRKGTYLKVPNLGRLLKALMRTHLGDWEASAERLQQAATSCQSPQMAAPAALR